MCFAVRWLPCYARSMICERCEIRSSIGFCVACKRMLCDVCAVHCDQCGKLTCENHAYEGIGMVYCATCGEENDARPRETVLQVSKGAARDADPTRRPYRNPPAWVMALVMSVLALTFAGLLYLHPGFRWLPLPVGASVPIVLFVPLAALAGLGWSIGGFRERQYPRKPEWCLAGLCLSAVALAGSLLAAYSEIVG